MPNMPVKYVAKKSTKLKRLDGKRIELIWGDRCDVRSTSGSLSRVFARGQEGFVKSADLGNKSLLEIYVIDVGQGDAVLMKTPDEKWHLIDAGVSNRRQMTRQGAANFIRWKFFEDLRKSKVSLENVILSHADSDHFGGLLNVFGGILPAYGSRPLRTFNVDVKNFYHNGMGRFEGSDPLGKTKTGTVADFPRGDRGVGLDGKFIVELLDGKSDFSSPSRNFNSRSGFEDLAALVGSVPDNAHRICKDDRFLPGYDDGEECTIHILGPILEKFTSTRRGLRFLQNSESKTRNGQSIVLRVDYGASRILLTGDLNTKSQKLLLSYIPETDFSVDVAKACHHGSDDIDLGFIKAMGARSTVISSGDNESYAHPRPRVLGASAKYGREGVDPKGHTMPPLIYSTELARSIKLGFADQFEFDFTETNGDEFTYSVPIGDARFDPEGRDNILRPLGSTPLSLDLIYGLVNVRTDGEEILFATMMESGNNFDKRVIRAGVSPD